MREFKTAPAPHLPPRTSVQRVMLTVMIALLPGTLAQAWLFGPGVLLQIVFAAGFALSIEAVLLRLRGQPLAPFLLDGSAVVTAWLFALCIPPLSPWWISLIAMLAAIGCAKHLYGGLGHNLFNPAMVGYAVVLICFPVELSRWLPSGGWLQDSPSLLDNLRLIVTGNEPSAGWDASTGATALERLRELGRAGLSLSEVRADPAFGDLGGQGWEWVALCHLLGGVALCWLRIADWRTPMAVLGTVFLLSLPFWLFDPDLHPSPLQHIALGGLVLAAFFIATDPVSGCTTTRGRWLFGAGVAILVLAIRRWGAYPDGIAFAILLMNAAAPLLDRLTPPRAHGR